MKARPAPRNIASMNFSAMQCASRPEKRARAPTSKTSATLELVSEPSASNLAELSWRTGIPVSALILSVLAVPLSFMNPRAGRSLNLVLALLIYMTYSNLLSIVQAWIAQSRMSFAAGMSVHFVMVGVLVLFFYRRISLFSFLRLSK